MQKKTFWTILLTCLLFLASVFVGGATVYRVDHVTVKAALISEDAKTEAAALQEKLLSAYKGESSFSLDEKAANTIFKEFPYFQMKSFKAKYPNKLVVEITEDDEVFAVQTESGDYCILGLDGTVFGTRSSLKNRSDGADNILLAGLTPTGVRGEIVTGEHWSETLAFCNAASEKLNGIRSNVVAVNFEKPSASVSRLTLQMKEGVKIVVNNPDVGTTDMAAAAIDCYTGLTDSARLTGEIWVSVGSDGSVRASHRL